MIMSPPVWPANHHSVVSESSQTSILNPTMSIASFLLTNNTLLYQFVVTMLIQVILSSFNNAKNIQSANGFKEKEQYKFQNVFLNPFVIHYNLLL